METEPPSLYLITFLLEFSVINLVWVGLLLVLLLASALVSGSEVAYFSLSKKDLEEHKEKNSRNIQIVSNLLKKKNQLLATILILNNFINISIVLLSAYLSKIYVHPYIPEFKISSYSINLQLFFDLAIITFILLLFGEIIPKVYAGRNNYSSASIMAKPLQISSNVLKPFSSLLISMSKSIGKRLKRNPSISVDQLSQALELTSEDNKTTLDEQKILEGIVSFGNTETIQIMTPRVDMFTITHNLSFKEVVKEVSNNGFSRIPVHKNKIDEISGVLYAKDLIPHLNRENFEWQTLLRKAFFVPETKKLNDLLIDFQEKKIHLAIVVDEYGGTSGVVSLEDVIEEIVGDISDEFDDDGITYSKLNDNNFIFEGKTSLKDVCKIMEIDDQVFDEKKGEAETLAGLILEITEHYPQKKQIISLDNFDFTIEALNKKRIKQIKVTNKVLNEQ